MISVYQTTFPPSNTPIVDTSGNMSQPGMAFFRVLYNRTGQGAGLVNQVSSTVTAVGTTSATATQLTSDWNYVSSGTGGVLLPALTGGQIVMVQTVSGIKVYPPSGSLVDGVASYTLGAGKMQIFWFITASQIISTQLG